VKDRKILKKHLMLRLLQKWSENCRKRNMVVEFSPLPIKYVDSIFSKTNK